MSRSLLKDVFEDSIVEATASRPRPPEFVLEDEDSRRGPHRCLYLFTLLKADIRSLYFVVTRFLMKLFKSINTDTINDCRIYFNFLMPSELLEIRRNRFDGKFIYCCNLLYYFGINKIM